jgi:hypothetical protein
MNTPAIAKLVIQSSSSDEISSGVCASFIRISDKEGLKYYEDKYVRDFTYKIQKRASKYGVAPKVGGKFTIKISGKKFYGYITEAILYTHKDQYKAGKIKHGIVGHIPGYTDLIDTLKKKVKITTSDIHWGNIGWLPNGQLVAIDFSEEIDYKSRVNIDRF